MSRQPLALVATPFFGQATGAKPGAHSGRRLAAMKIPRFLDSVLRFQLLYKTAGKLGLSYFAFCQRAKSVNVVMRVSGGVE